MMSEVTETEKIAETPAEHKTVRKEVVGTVVSDKMKKTIVVNVTRRVPHPHFRKIIGISKKFYAHDEKEEAKVGDKVKIGSVRPLSKLKRWELIEIMAH